MRTILALLITAASLRAQSLRIYAIDADGKSTLYVSPSGESMLVDTGVGLSGPYAGPAFGEEPVAAAARASDRIVAAAKAAGVKRIDYLVITHYHADHTGGVAQLAAKIPIQAFFDHGVFDPDHGNVSEKAIYHAYATVRDKYPHTTVRPGDTVPIKGIHVDVVAAGGETIARPLKGGGQPNPLCDNLKLQPVANGENPRSIALMITFGNLRIVDLGDLAANPGERLTCPVNHLGIADIYLTAHHGVGQDNPAQIVQALRPRVVIMNNNSKHGGEYSKGADPIGLTLHHSPGFLDLWQLHYSEVGRKDLNPRDEFIANPVEPCEGKWIEVSGTSDGRFTVRNSRNGFEKKYTK